MSDKEVLKSQNANIEEAPELTDEQAEQITGGTSRSAVMHNVLLHSCFSTERYIQERARLAKKGYSEYELSIIFDGLY